MSDTQTNSALTIPDKEEFNAWRNEHGETTSTTSKLKKKVLPAIRQYYKDHPKDAVNDIRDLTFAQFIAIGLHIRKNNEDKSYQAIRRYLNALIDWHRYESMGRDKWPAPGIANPERGLLKAIFEQDTDKTKFHIVLDQLLYPDDGNGRSNDNKIAIDKNNRHQIFALRQIAQAMAELGLTNGMNDLNGKPKKVFEVYAKTMMPKERNDGEKEKTDKAQSTPCSGLKPSVLDTLFAGHGMDNGLGMSFTDLPRAIKSTLNDGKHDKAWELYETEAKIRQLLQDMAVEADHPQSPLKKYDEDNDFRKLIRIYLSVALEEGVFGDGQSITDLTTGDHIDTLKKISDRLAIKNDRENAGYNALNHHHRAACNLLDYIYPDSGENPARTIRHGILPEIAGDSAAIVHMPFGDDDQAMFLKNYAPLFGQYGEDHEFTSETIRKLNLYGGRFAVQLEQYLNTKGISIEDMDHGHQVALLQQMHAKFNLGEMALYELNRSARVIYAKKIEGMTDTPYANPAELPKGSIQTIANGDDDDISELIELARVRATGQNQARMIDLFQDHSDLTYKSIIAYTRRIGEILKIDGNDGPETIDDLINGSVSFTELHQRCNDQATDTIPARKYRWALSALWDVATKAGITPYANPFKTNSGQNAKIAQQLNEHGKIRDTAGLTIGVAFASQVIESFRDSLSRGWGIVDGTATQPPPNKPSRHLSYTVSPS